MGTKGRQLKSFDNIQYTYNANGIRTSKTVGGVKHTYTLDGTKILSETWGNNTLIPLYDNEESVCGINYNGTPYYFQKNLQGDIIAITDKTATVVARYSYDAWGVPTITQDTSDCSIAQINPFRYRGYYYDQEVGLYYLQSRYYNSEIGRFINCDSVDCLINGETANKLNQFSYCENEPVYNEDPNGMWIQYVIGAAIGGILNVVFYVIDCAMAKEKVDLWKALLNFLNGAVNGVIATAGAALIWQIIAGISSALVSLFIGASSPTFEDFIIAVICGILSGILAGTLTTGANKHINYLMKNFGKKIKTSIFRSEFGKNLLKSTKYVFKNSKKIIWKFIKSYCIPNILISATPKIKSVLGV